MSKVFSFPNKQRLFYISIYGIIATVVFTVIYGYCNEAATRATSLYSVFTDWELQIPLIPWMIYPYLSLNLLFIFAIFVIKDTSAIKAYCMGLAIAAICAGIVFYLFPAQLGFVREVVPGYEKIFGSMFDIDHPHNLFPSLHVTYSSLSVWIMIEQTKNSFFHFIMRLWLVLISASVVLVHQHHIFDILTGLILSLFIFKFVVKKYHPNNFKPLFLFS